MIDKPSLPLLCKLASIVVHADELTSEHGHEFDKVALQSVMRDSEVQNWVGAMVAAGLAPKKRNP